MPQFILKTRQNMSAGRAPEISALPALFMRRKSIPAYSEKGLGPRLPDTKKAVLDLLEGEELSGFSGVGIAMPGIVDPEKKRVLGLYKKYEDSKEMDLEGWCREAFGLPAFLEMDSKLALAGELHMGCGRGYEDAVMMILGTGVGTAVSLGGKILRSRNYTAGALASHLIVNLRGADCTCPNQGCLEAEASGWALPGLLRRHPGFSESGISGEEKLDFRSLQKWVLRKDPVAEEVLLRCVEVWRAGILNLIHAYDPQLVILSGAVMNFQGLFQKLTEGIERCIWDCCGPVVIKEAEYPEDSVLFGLYYLVRNGGVI